MGCPDVFDNAQLAGETSLRKLPRLDSLGVMSESAEIGSQALREEAGHQNKHALREGQYMGILILLHSHQ